MGNRRILMMGLSIALSIQVDKCAKEDNVIIDNIVKDKALLAQLRDTSLEIQVRYTQIDRDANNNPSFKVYTWHESDAYFYPASTVKMPVAFAALQKWRGLKAENPCFSIYDPLYIQKGRVGQQSDSTHAYEPNKPPSIYEHIRLVFAISDNNAYNRLYEFTGQQYVNEQLRSKGIFTNSRIIHRVGVGGYSFEDNQWYNPMTLGKDGCQVSMPLRNDKSAYTHMPGEMKGKGYLNNNDEIVNKPFDFTQKNYLSLKDLEASLMRIVFPDAFPMSQRFDLLEEDYSMMYKILDELPRDISYLKNDSHYYDNYVKYYYNSKDSSTIIPDHIHIFNKVGWAYGTLTDCSYVFDEKTGAEFFLTSTILTNKNQIFNDGVYEYESVGLPFFSKLGEAVLSYEQGRDRKVKPDFGRLLGK